MSRAIRGEARGQGFVSTAGGSGQGRRCTFAECDCDVTGQGTRVVSVPLLRPAQMQNRTKKRGRQKLLRRRRVGCARSWPPSRVWSFGLDLHVCNGDGGVAEAPKRRRTEPICPIVRLSQTIYSRTVVSKTCYDISVSSVGHLIRWPALSLLQVCLEAGDWSFASRTRRAERWWQGTHRTP